MDRAKGAGRRAVIAVGIATMALGMTPARAASSTTCRLQVTASFSPGLTLTPTDQTIRVTGGVSMCSAAGASPAATGSSSVGNVWTDPATGFKWQEPPGTANGFCGHTTVNATSITRFVDGTVTVLAYQTASVVSGVVLVGNVRPSVTLAAVDRQPGQPDTLTVASTRNVGGTAVGTLVATASDPAACGGTGLTSVTIDGQTTTIVAP